MSEFVEKIAERYSDELARVFPIQNIASAVFLTFLLCMAESGAYITAIESTLRISIDDLLNDWAGLKNITLGMVMFSLTLVIVSHAIYRGLAKLISRFVLKGYNLTDLSSQLFEKSRAIPLPVDVAASLANSYSERLNTKRSQLKRASSLGEFLLTFGLCELIISIYWTSPFDLFYFVGPLALSCWVNFWLVFKFVGDILPLEAHIFGIKGVPYDLSTTIEDL